MVALGHSAHYPGPAGPLQLAGIGHPCPAAGATCRPLRSAWYAKQHPTFSDVLAFLRQMLWRRTSLFHKSPFPTDSKNRRSLRRPRLWMSFATLRDCTKSS